MLIVEEDPRMSPKIVEKSGLSVTDFMVHVQIPEENWCHMELEGAENQAHMESKGAAN